MAPVDPAPCPDGEPTPVAVVGNADGVAGRVEGTVAGLPAFDVTVVSSAEEALDTRPACVLITAGGERDPLSVARVLTAADGDLPVVSVTAETGEYDPASVLDAGVTAMLTVTEATDPTAVGEVLEAETGTYRRRSRQRRDSSVLDSMLSELPVHMFVKDDDARHVRVSDARYDSEELLGRTDHEVCDEISPETGPHADDLRVLESGEPILNTEEYAAADDEWHLTSKAPWYDDGEIVGLVGLSIDITERKRRQQLLRNTSRLLRAIVHASPLPIAVHGPEGTVQLWNAAAEELFGWTEGEIVGDAVPPQIPAEQRGEFRALLDRAKAEGSVSGVGIVGQSRTGDRLDLQVSASTVEPTGDDERIVTIYSDVTTLRERERRIERRKQRLEAFTTVLAHDLRNPLQVIQGQLEHAADPEFDEAAVGRALDRIGLILDDVLTLAQQDPVVDDAEPTRLSGVARKAWEDGTGELVVESDCTIDAAPDRLRRLLSHLFENARCHAGEDGALTVRIGCTDDGFFVADDGDGIDDEEKGRVLEPGYSTSPGQTGYGLSIVQEIAAAHGWSVTLEDGPDGGALVRFTDVAFADADPVKRKQCE